MRIQKTILAARRRRAEANLVTEKSPKRIAPLVQHICKKCGKEFYGHGCARYCSDECRKAATKEYLHNYNIARNGPRVYVCKVCGKEFPGRKNAEYCSDECLIAGRREYYREYYKQRERIPKKHTCKVCGKEFYANKNERYCNEECRKEGLRRYKTEYTCIHYGKKRETVEEKQKNYLQGNSNFIARRRIELGMTQKQIAEAIDVSLPMFRSWEYGKSDSHAAALLKLAKVLGCTIEELLKGIAQHGEE